MVIEYTKLRGSSKNMKLKVITKIANYFEREIKYQIPSRTPFIGDAFNKTRAGIHADGILKDEEIYNIFDTERILNRPVVVTVGSHSGLAGIAVWMNKYFKLERERRINKRDPMVLKLKEYIDKEYAKGRVTSFSDEELESLITFSIEGRGQGKGKTPGFDSSNP
jgi:isopropylmalate/homocitrate/citramalate synthase